MTTSNNNTHNVEAEADTESQPKSQQGAVASRLQSKQNKLLDKISSDDFTAWYREREVAQNIKNGQAYFNGPSSIKPPERHSPSQFLQCHRKSYYSAFNAPKESEPPRGIFYFGSRFEEDIVVPFLEDVAGDQAYVTNSMWIDFTEETAAGPLRIKGETDPVIVTRENDPLLLTESKTKQSLENVSAPSDRHRAQVHAYMCGLSASDYHDGDVTTAVIIYGSRTSLDIKAFKVDFDTRFWEKRVLNWASKQTQYQIEDDLPPATPENGWECNYCSFKERCGQGQKSFKHEDVTGLLPGIEYPREHLEEYLAAHRNAKLTPTLAYLYPDLAQEYGVYEWSCSNCDERKLWDEPDWRPDMETLPRCQHCSQNGTVSLLSAPVPAEQSVVRGGEG